jgi:hypothetical protein
MNSIRPDSETVSEPFGSRRMARPGMTDGAGRCAGASVTLNLKLRTWNYSFGRGSSGEAQRVDEI